MPFSKWLGLRYQVFISLELITRKVLCLVLLYVVYTHTRTRLLVLIDF